MTGASISSVTQNSTETDIANGLTSCITRDGQSPATANIPLGANKITGLAAGTATTDAANVAQVQGSQPSYLTIGGTANVITATSSPSFAAYVTGGVYQFIAGSTNTTAVTMQINGIAGAKAVTKFGTVALTAGNIIAGGMYFILYDGTRFQLINPSSGLLQLVSGSGGGASTTSVNPNFANLINSVVTITPRSASSVLLIEISFIAQIANVAATNTIGTFQLYETNTNTPIGSTVNIQAFSSAGGTGAAVPGIVRAVIPSTGVVARSFGFMGYTSIVTAACSGTNYVATITEVLA